MIWYMRGFAVHVMAQRLLSPRRFFAFLNCTTAPRALTSTEATKRAQRLTKVEAFARHRPPAERSTRLRHGKEPCPAIGRLQMAKRVIDGFSWCRDDFGLGAP